MTLIVNNKVSVIGVTSFGYACAQKPYPGIKKPFSKNQNTNLKFSRSLCQSFSPEELDIC